MAYATKLHHPPPFGLEMSDGNPCFCSLIPKQVHFITWESKWDRWVSLKTEPGRFAPHLSSARPAVDRISRGELGVLVFFFAAVSVPFPSY